MSRNLVSFRVFFMLAALLSGASSFAQEKGAVPQNNIVRNADFKESFRHWLMVGNGTNLYHPEDPGRAQFTVTDGTVDIFITNEGISVWSVMLYQEVPLKKGTEYVVSFSAKSDLERTVISNITQDHTWRNISGDRSFTLTKNMKKYEYRFTMTYDGDALFQFCLGRIGTGHVYVSDLLLAERRKTDTR